MKLGSGLPSPNVTVHASTSEELGGVIVKEPTGMLKSGEETWYVCAGKAGETI